MKKILYLILCNLFINLAFAQNPGDTIIVQTLDYSSNTRDTIAFFPNDTNLIFEKLYSHTI